MAITAKIDVRENDILGSLRAFFEDILELEDIHAILVPQHLPMKNMVMPTLVTDPDQLTGVDPLAPAFAPLRDSGLYRTGKTQARSPG